MTKIDPSDARFGGFCGIAAYLGWGLLPLYLLLLDGVPSLQILAHRVIWSLALLMIAATLLRRWPGIRAAAGNWHITRLLMISAALIGTNWLLYIWAVMNGHVLEASMGYFINPLVNVALGVILLGERLRPAQMCAVALATVGVAAMAVGGGGMLLVSLGLALSFAFYGLVRKVTPVDALGGLLIETSLLFPAALLLLLWTVQNGTSAFGNDRGLDLLLIIVGAVTAAPLLLFAAAARRVQLTTLGLLQYIAPTLQFLCAILVFGEHMTRLHGFTFACIWAGLLIYAADSLRAARQDRTMRPEPILPA